MWPAVGLLAYGAIAFAGGVAFLDSLRPALQNLSGATTTRRAVSAAARAPGNYLRSWVGGAAVETLAIDIGFKHLHTLHEKRAEAMETGVLLASSKDYVPARITHDGRTVPVKLRLQSDLAEHFQGAKWSMRIAVKGDDHLFGMRRFTLLAPEVRGFQTERFFLDHLSAEGVLAPRYFFANVRINGDDIGLMAVQEHFAKELLESQQRRDGVIVRFNEKAYWESVRYSGHHGPFDSYLNTSIQPFLSSRVDRNPKLSAELRVAIGLLRSFVEGDLPASEVFDVESTARFLAVAEVWRSQGALRWNHLRFYFNPLSGRLEPIGFAGDLTRPYDGPGLVTQSQPFSRALLEDAAIRATFVRALRRVAGELVDGPLIERLRMLERADLVQFHREYPFRAAYDFEPVKSRAATLLSVDPGSFGLFAPAMGDAGRRHPKALLAYVERDDRGLFLELSNALPVPVAVTELRFADLGVGPAANFADATGVELPIQLAPTAFQSAPTPVRIDFRPPPGANGRLPAVEGVAMVQGQSRRYPFRTVPYQPPLRRSPVPTATLAEVLAQHPFLAHDAEAGELVSESGVWDVRGSLALPPGLGLRLLAGTTLRFGPGEGLVATGPLRFQGEPGAPVRLEGPPGDDPSELWSGIAVLGSERPSHWTQVHVLRTGGFRREGWTLPAGVVFRRADVSMESCRLAYNRTEDALNIIRSQFTLSDVEIVDSVSDALDADFSEGRIEGGRIWRAGGDGIDVSGSQVHLSEVQLSEIHDKAVSVGERSRLTASGLVISRSGTAFVSKDRSRGEIRDSRISEIAHTALMAYAKKVEYGPAELEANENAITRVQRVAMAQTGSRVVIDGRSIPTEDVDIDRLYKEGYMRK